MSMKYIFGSLDARLNEKLSSLNSYSINVSFLQILDGNLVDLSKNENELRWTYDASTMTESIGNLTKTKVKNAATAINLIEQCLNCSAINSNSNNNNNKTNQSLTHLIFTIVVKSVMKDRRIIRGTGNFIMFAGSEHVVSNNDNQS